MTTDASEACSGTEALRHPWFCPEAIQGPVPFSSVLIPARALGCSMEWNGQGARALWLQELRWSCCQLGCGLPLWQTSPRICPPQIEHQAVMWSGWGCVLLLGNEPLFSTQTAFLWHCPLSTECTLSLGATVPPGPQPRLLAAWHAARWSPLPGPFYLRFSA